MNYQYLINSLLTALSPLIGLPLPPTSQTSTTSERYLITHIEFLTIRPTWRRVTITTDPVQAIRFADIVCNKDEVPAAINYGYVLSSLEQTVKRMPFLVATSLLAWHTPTLVIPNCGIIQFHIRFHADPT